MTSTAKHSVVSSVTLSGGRGIAVVYDWMFFGQNRAENLELLSIDGATIWRAKLPTSDGMDSFVSIALDANCLRANIWSGWAVWLNPETGEAVRMEFVK
jgi:hypothetical protein